MLKNTAIICEFNPLHNGHKAILAYARAKAGEMGGAVIAVMSGNFTQRSESAVFDKYKRAELAVRMGADAVFELPFPWCSSGGEFFALGGVGIAAGLGINNFIFGSETGDTDYVRRAASLISDGVPEGDRELGAAVSSDRFLAQYGLSLSSNDKLAAEYMRAAEKLGLDAEFSAYTRMTSEEVYRSASEIRKMIYFGETFDDFVPEETLKICGKNSDVRELALTELMFNHFRIYGASLEKAFDAEGGVSERLNKAAAEARCAEEFFPLAATKKYTNSRLRRAALFTLMGVKKTDLTTPPRFTVLLAANEKGREFLSRTKKTRSISVITKPSYFTPADEIEKRQYELWQRADELYTLCLKESCKAGEYMRRSPKIL